MNGWHLLSMMIPPFYPKPAMTFISFDGEWLFVEVCWLWFVRRRQFRSVGTGWRREDGEISPINEALALTELAAEQQKGKVKDD